jgi:hypothetical protein
MTEKQLTEAQEETMTVQDFYELQAEKPNQSACEPFWTGECGGTPPEKSLYELGVPRAPPPGRNCLKCRKFRNLELLANLIKDDYQIEFNGKSYTCTRAAYLDDGYGTYGTAYAEITVSRRGNIMKITVEGMTKKQIEQKKEQNQKLCPLWRKKGVCGNDEEVADWEATGVGNCSECTLLEMYESLAEEIEDCY